MDYEWDEKKNDRNTLVHGVSFDFVDGFDWHSAIIACDDRRDYGEVRCVAYSFINKRLFVCVYTQRGSTRRIISLRKANKREVSFYEEVLETTNR